MLAFIDRLWNEHKFARRATLVWACWLITVVVLRVTQPDVLEKVNAATATVVTAVVGLLATVIAFYQWSRQSEEGTNDHPS